MLQVGTVLAARYRIAEPLAGSWSRPVHLGRDQQSSEPIVLFELEEEEATRLERAVGVSHPHLASVLAVVRTESQKPVLVTEHVTGVRLDELLAEGSKPAVDAVRSALRVADAAAALHAAGSAHGALQPEAIIVEPDGRASPAVVWLPARSGSNPYRSPERGANGPGSEADDEWAITGLLYEMLTGLPPPASGIRAADDLVPAGVEDAALRESLAHGLAADASKRSSDVRPLKRELARWFVEHAGEEYAVSPHPGSSASRPPPLPAGAAPHASASHTLGQVPGVSSSTAPIAKSSRRLPLLAGAGIVLGIAAAWGVSMYRSRPREQVVEVAAAAPSASAKAIDLGEVPVTGESTVLTGDKTATCVAGYLPKGAFARAPKLDWMCGEKDPREGASKLRVAVVQGSPPIGGPTEAMKIFSQLGWYDMAAFAVVRAGCCVDSEPIVLPDPSPNCGRMDEPLRELGRTVIVGQPHETALKAYEQAIGCELTANRAALYRRAGRPHSSEAVAFGELVKVIQSP
jgi:hypothetical protein